MNFDNEIAELERAINLRKKNLHDFQGMHKEAEGTRDVAKVWTINLKSCVIIADVE